MAERSRIGDYGELVRRNENFRRLWLGQIVSLLGDWFNLIALTALTASLNKSDTGLAVSGVFVARMLAPFVVGPLAGVAADRYNRKHLLILADIGRGIVVLGFLLIRDPEHAWLLYVLSIVQFALSGFFFPARSAILPDLVSREELGTANALSSVTWSVMLAFGAALGGLVAGNWGMYPAFAIDSLTFFVSAWFIWHISYPHVSGAFGASLGAALREYADGLRYLRAELDVLAVALQKSAIAVVLSGPFDVIQVKIAKDLFSIGEEGGTSLGIMFAVIGVGTGVGPILARRFTGDRDRALRMAVAASYLITVIGLVIMAPMLNFWIVLVGIALRAAGAGIIWVFTTQILLQTVPDRVRGRVFGTEFMLFTLLYSAGALVAGVALERSGLSLSQITWIAAGLFLVPGALWTWWNVGRARPDRRIPVGD